VRVNEPLLALHSHTFNSAVDRDELVRIGLVMIGRAEKGVAEPRSIEGHTTIVGTATRCTSHHFSGPRGGRAVVVSVVGTTMDAASSLSLARTALESLLSPSWSASDKDHAQAVMVACGLLAMEARPDAELWGGFQHGPTGPNRAECLARGRGASAWIGTNALNGAFVADCLPGIAVDVEKPRNHGMTAHTITLTQNRRIVRRETAMALNAMERLRYAQLARRP
jgi:hypothetical protein